MKTAELETNFFLYGNKGNVWSDNAHIAETGSSTTLCGTPMLATNWAKVSNVVDPKCEECNKIYKQKTEKQPAYIQVVVTEKRFFRARITPKDTSLPKYEVTLGGQEWKKGKGSEYRKEILDKCQSTITRLQHELNEASNG